MSGGEPILLVAACYKQGEESPFTIEIVSNAPLSLQDAPLKNPTPPPQNSTRAIVSVGGKKAKKNKKNKKKGSSLDAAKKSMAQMGSMYDNL